MNIAVNNKHVVVINARKSNSYEHTVKLLYSSDKSARYTECPEIVS